MDPSDKLFHARPDQWITNTGIRWRSGGLVLTKDTIVQTYKVKAEKITEHSSLKDTKGCRLNKALQCFLLNEDAKSPEP